MKKLIFGCLLPILIQHTYSQSYDPCVDKYTQCKMWKMQNMCSMSTYKQYMISTCPESCDLCAQTSEAPKVISHNFTVLNSTVTSKPLEPLFFEEPRKTTSESDKEKKEPEVQYQAREPTVEVTTIPQAMKLIQSLSQMISHSASRKNIRAHTNFERNKIRINERGKKKNMLKFDNTNPDVPIPMSKRAKYDDSDLIDELNSNEQTLKMLIQNKKRSALNSHFERNKRGHLTKAHKSNVSLKKKSPLKSRQSVMGTQPQTSTNINTSVLQSPSSITATPSYESSGEPIEVTQQNISRLIPTGAVPQATEPEEPEIETTTEAPVEYEPTTLSASPTEVAELQTTQPPPQTITELEPPSEEPQERYSMIIKQTFDPDYEDTTCSKYSILKGNVVQDFNYALGSDVVIGEVDFESVSGKSPSTSLTKVYFTISGDLSSIPKLQVLVDSGNVNGLRVQPKSLRKE